MELRDHNRLRAVYDALQNSNIADLVSKIFLKEHITHVNSYELLNSDTLGDLVSHWITKNKNKNLLTITAPLHAMWSTDIDNIICSTLHFNIFLND